MTVARVAVAVVAVAVLAWLVTMERDLRLRADGLQAAQSQQFDRAERDLRASRLLDPDTAPDLSLAFVAQTRGRSRAAIAQIENVLRREPDNLAAWALLYRFGQNDPARAARALAARRRLDPINARR
jgi:predicted Zn-dependent protease